MIVISFKSKKIVVFNEKKVLFSNFLANVIVVSMTHKKNLKNILFITFTSLLPKTTWFITLYDFHFKSIRLILILLLSICVGMKVFPRLLYKQKDIKFKISKGQVCRYPFIKKKKIVVDDPNLHSH